MPRICLTRADRLKQILFSRTKIRVPNSEIARRLGCCNATIGNYRSDPERIPFGKAIDLANAMGVTDEEWILILRG